MDQQDKASTSVVIDQDGDTLLILTNPVERLKSWNKVHFGHGTYELENDIEPAGESKQVHATANGPSLPDKAPPEFRYLVSSFHLKNASSYFRNMFSLGFSECLVDPNDGKYHVIAQSFNPKALEHILNIIHVKNWRLPKHVEVEQMAHMAVVVDYYQMHGAVSFHVTVWQKILHDRVWKTPTPKRGVFPNMYCPPLVLHTFVARMFGNEEGLKRGAAIILREISHPIHDMGIPLLGLAGEFSTCPGKSPR
jgi:hypothetical protein